MTAIELDRRNIGLSNLEIELLHPIPLKRVPHRSEQRLTDTTPAPFRKDREVQYFAFLAGDPSDHISDDAPRVLGDESSCSFILNRFPNSGSRPGITETDALELGKRRDVSK
jgi:hypothetical protein